MSVACFSCCVQAPSWAGPGRQVAYGQSLHRRAAGAPHRLPAAVAGPKQFWAGESPLSACFSSGWACRSAGRGLPAWQLPPQRGMVPPAASICGEACQAGSRPEVRKGWTQPAVAHARQHSLPCSATVWPSNFGSQNWRSSIYPPPDHGVLTVGGGAVDIKLEDLDEDAVLQQTAKTCWR